METLRKFCPLTFLPCASLFHPLSPSTAWAEGDLVWRNCNLGRSTNRSVTDGQDQGAYSFTIDLQMQGSEVALNFTDRSLLEDDSVEQARVT